MYTEKKPYHKFYKLNSISLILMAIKTSEHNKPFKILSIFPQHIKNE